MTLVYLAIAWTCGILLGQVLRTAGILTCNTPLWAFGAAAGACVVGLAALRRLKGMRLGGALLLFLILGAWRYQAAPFDPCVSPDDLSYHHAHAADGVWAMSEGTVIGYPEVRDAEIHYQVEVTRVTIDAAAYDVQGRALVRAPLVPAFSYGDRVRVTGLLLTPPVLDDFDYRRYLAARNIHTLIRRPTIALLSEGHGSPFWHALYAVRTRASAVLNRILPEPAAGLANGMVLGIEGGISEEVSDAFRATGTTHLIVISGSNIAFLSGALVAALAGVLSRRRAALVAAPIVLLYVLLVGADPPALRAGVMGLLGLGAIYFGRRGTAYVSLCAAGLLMTAINPLALWDIGFQLSFATSLGLILFQPPLSRAVAAWLGRRLSAEAARRVAAVLDATLTVTLAAQVAVLPLLLAYFGQLSIISLVTNALVAPVQPAILASGIAALLAGLASLPFGQVVAALPWALLGYTVAVIRLVADIPFALVPVGRSGPLFVMGYYAVVAALLARGRLALAARSHRRLVLAGALAAVVALLFWSAWRTLPDGRLHVLFVSAGGGEAAALTTPGGRTAWAWDGRGDGAALVRATQRGPWRGDRPDVVLAPCALSPWPGAACIDPAGLDPGAAVRLEPGASLVRLDAGAGWALALEHGGFRTLLPPTLPQEAQAALVAEDAAGPYTVLKAPGPGTGAWPSAALIRDAAPQAVVWPLTTTYPPDVRDALAAARTIRVDPAARVEVVTDGEGFALATHSAAGPR